MKKLVIRGRSDRTSRVVRLAEHDSDLNVQQQFKEDCDINGMVVKARRGIPPKFVRKGQPHYADFSNVPDLTEAFSIMERATESFRALPAALRLELHNDPRNLGQLTLEQAERYRLTKTIIREDESDEGSTPPGQPSRSPEAVKPASLPSAKGSKNPKTPMKGSSSDQSDQE